MKKYILLLLIIVLLPFQTLETKASSLGQEVIFKNNNLKIQVQDKLGFEKITREDMLEIEKIVVSNVNDLSGLEYAKNLSILEISNSEVNLFFINELNNLENLKLKDSIFKLNDISQAISLRNLNIENCQITDLFSLNSLVNLEKLSLKNNYIHSLMPILNLINLEVLDLEGNFLTDLYDILALNMNGSFSTTESSINISNNFLNSTTGSVTDYNIKLLENKGIKVKCGNQNVKQNISEVVIKEDDQFLTVSMSEYIHAKASQSHIFENKNQPELVYIKSEDDFYKYQDYKDFKSNLKYVYKTVGVLNKREKEVYIDCQPYDFN